MGAPAQIRSAPLSPSRKKSAWSRPTVTRASRFSRACVRADSPVQMPPRPQRRNLWGFPVANLSRAAAPRSKDSEIANLDRPKPAGVNAAGFGSDVAADALRALDIPYIALNPGASYRGLHDSIVNYLGNERPQMLLCLHEESAIAIAHGYAKVTGK